MSSALYAHRFSENELLQTASAVCALSPKNILLIGGGMVLRETAGFKRLRYRSDDLDFIVNDMGLEEALKQQPFSRDTLRSPEHNVPSESYCMYSGGILLALFHNQIRGYHIPQNVFQAPIVRQTTQGTIYTIEPELNVALKVRRGATREVPHVYGKDGLDFATMAVGVSKLGRAFDVVRFAGYLREGVCGDCKLGQSEGCVAGLARKSVQNLPSGERPLFESVLSACEGVVSNFCKYHA